MNKTKFEDSFNKNLEYSEKNSEFIDKRIWKVCKEAENNYLENQKTIKEIQNLKKFDIVLEKKKFKDSKTDYETTNSIKKPESNNISKSIEFIKLPNVEKDESSFLNLNDEESLKLFQSNGMNKIDLPNKNTLSIKHNHKNSKRCIACDLKKRIEDKGNVQHPDHVKFKINYDINKLILLATTLIKKKQFKKSFEILKLPIQQGVYHSDIFYLFGEVCRVLKKMEDSEKYLLECLKFEYHSPFVFYSLGLLYQETSQYNYSISLFKHFLKIIETADAHYKISKSYIEIKKYLKAALHLTKAISINFHVYEYFKLRASLYKKMGYNELAEDDEKLANNLISNKGKL